MILRDGASRREKDKGIVNFVADDFKFFENKIDGIRRQTECAIEPVYLSSSCCHSNEFSPISQDDAMKIILATQ